MRGQSRDPLGAALPRWGPAALAFLALAACGSPSGRPPQPPAGPAPDDRRAKGEEIVALYNGRPLTWRAVAERAMEADLKHAVDQYVRGRIVEERRAALGIVNTPAELRRRAESLARQARERMGEAAFRDQLSREGFTEEAYLDHWAGSRLLDEALALEKIVRTEATRQGTLEIDRTIFADERDARRFTEICKEKGFDAASDRFQGTGRITRLPRESFSRGMPPAAPPLDPWIVESLARMKPGDVTGVETASSNQYCVIRLVYSRAGRDAPYSEVSGEVFEGILRDPPAPPEYKRWIDAEFSKARIEYADRSSPRVKGR